MGLEWIEFISRIEEDFDIRISDEVATTLVTPKTVIDYLMTIPKINEKYSRSQLSLTIMTTLEDEIGVSREKMNEDSRFIEDLRMLG